MPSLHMIKEAKLEIILTGLSFGGRKALRDTVARQLKILTQPDGRVRVRIVDQVSCKVKLVRSIKQEPGFVRYE